MKNALVGAALLVGLGVLARRLGPRLFESMPEDAPPKWMFRNITAIRENTDRILEILDRNRLDAEGSAAGPAT